MKQFNHKLLTIAIIVQISLIPNLIFAQNPTCPKPIKTGWETAKPFQFKDKDQLTGSDVEIFKAILTSMNCIVTFEEIPWERHLKEVANGKTDAAMGASKNPDRLKSSYFSDAYSGEAVLLYMLKENKDKYKFKTEKELAQTGIKLGAVAGSYLGEEFDKLVQEKILIKDKNYFEFANEKQLLDLLLAKRIDGFIYGGKEINFHKDIIVHPKKMFEHEAFFMFSKKTSTPDFIKEFNKHLGKLKNKGIIDGISKKFFTQSGTQY